jgi:hypothetical protein|tara:strand:+ start:183 stop:506 length:324 start_codon:yes stop_codon:yes gene_type:complete
MIKKELTYIEYESVKDRMYEYIESKEGNIYNVLKEYRQRACVDTELEPSGYQESELDEWARGIVGDIMSHDHLALQNVISDLMVSQFKNQEKYRDAIDEIFYTFKTQ